MFFLRSNNSKVKNSFFYFQSIYNGQIDSTGKIEEKPHPKPNLTCSEDVGACFNKFKIIYDHFITAVTPSACSSSSYCAQLVER